VWRSVNGVQGVPGSNPGVPTNLSKSLWFSDHRVVRILYAVIHLGEYSGAG
jgi:hypothetical protein